MYMANTADQITSIHTGSRLKAYSYLRFSTPEQMQGDSFRRQTNLAEDYARKHGLELDESLTFQDLGVSAFRGKNAEAGRLGDFLEAVRSGLVPRGSFLLVESLDRISRQAARKALRVLESIVDEGVVVVTLNDGRAYDAESLDDDPMSLMIALLTFIRANEESAMKARRLKAAWIGKRLKATDKPLTARAPAWLRLDKDAGRFKVIEDRAEVVRRIFKLTLDGYGQNRIAETFNREGVSCFGNAAYWHRSYVLKLLTNPAVVGTFIPHTLEYVDGKKVRKPQEPVSNYFPAIVDKDTYQRVQAVKIDTKAPVVRGKGELTNLLAGLARCPCCGGSMTRVMKGSGPKAGRPKLVCTRAKTGAGCTYHAVDLGHAEDALVRDAAWLVATVPSGDTSVDDRVSSVEAALEALSDQIGNLVSALSAGPSVALSARLRDMEAEKEALELERKELLERQAVVTGPIMAKKLEELKQALTSNPLDKTRTNALLRQVLSNVVVRYQTGQLEFVWKNGGISSTAFAFPTDSFLC